MLVWTGPEIKRDISIPDEAVQAHVNNLFLIGKPLSVIDGMARRWEGWAEWVLLLWAKKFYTNK